MVIYGPAVNPVRFLLLIGAYFDYHADLQNAVRYLDQGSEFCLV